ncbi:hypothetical protein MsedC_1595 [Metallosphaera sedula]|uniref:Uncharacterized protein n=1 Tax=Metallosphaera sedula TaxID=43687 RepID=A0A0K1SJ38_9CREN|nr:hypothetical protein MsedA_1595 [Metallosphaera sedula]AKV76807.1 hypothetical protein MsedB_1597 [Metallosphaera sedula]AKV79058.1 hypothetical protein MsedC_1595 [Metallosphaera sedula]AKV81303.1 hypothetical protein MsedD_1596 [Metallosphaera sedula]BBL47690.1 hypothetical protein MJ1HA_1791 [Metallosphaera sedula]
MARLTRCKNSKGLVDLDWPVSAQEGVRLVIQIRIFMGKNCIEIFRLVLIFDQNCYLFDRNKLDLRISYVFDDPDWD